jgi:prepilin-type N-terminal cleavage/methylation domain-containing protein
MAPCRTNHHLKKPGRQRSGFTLIETALTVTIVGVAIVAMCQLLAAGTIANVDGAKATTGMTLARDVREFALRLAFTDPRTPTVWGLDQGESGSNPTTFNDINDLAGRTFQPPIDSSGHALTVFNDWSQVVTVATVAPDMLPSTRPTGSQPANRVTVSVFHNKEKVCDLTWFVFDGTP